MSWKMISIVLATVVLLWIVVPSNMDENRDERGIEFSSARFKAGPEATPFKIPIGHNEKMWILSAFGLGLIAGLGWYMLQRERNK
jgi:hypothetical protein